MEGRGRVRVAAKVRGWDGANLADWAYFPGVGGSLGRGWSLAALSPAPPPSLSPPAMSASSSTCSSRKSSSCASRDGQDEEFFSMLESINTFGLDMEQVCVSYDGMDDNIVLSIHNRY